MTVSERRACKTLGVPRSTQRYRAKPVSSEERRLASRLHELARRYPRYGYRMMTAKLRQEGWHVNRKRVYRLWRQEGLKVPKKTREKRRLGHSGNSCVRRRAEHKDHVWCWDFIHDRTAAGKPLKWLAITDEYTRECLALEVDRSITADKVVDVLVNLFICRGVPKHIRSDNGPEFIAEAIGEHAKRTGLKMLYVEAGSPWENGFAESFFSRLRDEMLNCEEFANLAEAPMVREATERGAQRGTSTQQPRLPDPVGVCGQLCRGFRSGCALTPAAAQPKFRTITLNLTCSPNLGPCGMSGILLF